MTADDVRARFEAMAKGIGFFSLLANKDGIYDDPYTHGAWEFYRAALAKFTQEKP